MLFFIFLALLTVGIVCIHIYWRSTTSAENPLYAIGMLSLIFGGAAVLLSIGALIACYCTAEAEVDSLEVERASLMYQYENDLYDNDNDIGKKELMSEIQDFNTHLVKYKRYQRDPWIGIYVPNIYDDLEPIDISR